MKTLDLNRKVVDVLVSQVASQIRKGALKADVAMPLLEAIRSKCKLDYTPIVWGVAIASACKEVPNKVSVSQRKGRYYFVGSGCGSKSESDVCAVDLEILADSLYNMAKLLVLGGHIEEITTFKEQPDIFSANLF